MIIWITGISGVGKTTLAKKLYGTLRKKSKNIVHIDGDQFRKMLNNDLGYSLKDRDINAQRIINFVKFLNQFKINVIVSNIYVVFMLQIFISVLGSTTTPVHADRTETSFHQLALPNTQNGHALLLMLVIYIFKHFSKLFL